MAGEINFGILDTNAPLKVAASYNEGRKNRIADLLAQKQEQEFADDAAVREAYKTAGGDQNALLKQLYAGGNYKAAQDVQKQQLDLEGKRATIGKDKSTADKNAFDTASKKADYFGNVMASLNQNPSFENYTALMQQGVQAGIISPEEAQAHAAKMPRDPVQIKAQATQANQMLMSAKDRAVFDKPAPKEMSLGNRVAFIDMNPNSPTFKQELSSTSVGMNPGTAAQLAQSRERLNFDKSKAGAANGGIPAKPMPAAALKLQQEELDAIGISSSINADLGAVIKQLDSGKLNLGPVNNAVNTARNYVGMSNEESRNLNSFKATLEKMRNDSLRLNKGVQTEGDAVRAWDEILSNINDKPLVKERLAEVQAINERALNMRKMNVENIRRNYHQPDLETAGYENQKPAIGAGKSSGWSVTVEK